MTRGSYSSRLRAEQAAATRHRVVAAAGDLFARDGYSRTTLAAIARAAGVSVETVQAQGPKRTLLTAAVHQLSFGESQPEFFSADLARPSVESPTPAELCHRSAVLVAGLNAKTYRLWRAFASAAADDPEVDAAYGELSDFIRRQCHGIASALAEKGWLRDDIGTEEVGDSLWVLVGAEVYDKVTTRFGWSHERYVAWLTRSLGEVLFRGTDDVVDGPGRQGCAAC